MVCGHEGMVYGTSGAAKFLLDKKASSDEYRGMLTGRGFPKDTLKEVLLDPIEFAYQMSW